MCRRKTFFLFVLFFLFSLSAFSQDGNSQVLGVGSSGFLEQSSPEDPSIMTDAQIIAELMDNLKKREISIAEREQSISTKEARLTEREKDLMTREAIFIERNNLLEMRREILDETANYWKNYKKDTLKDKIFIGVLSFLGGYVTRLARE